MALQFATIVARVSPCLLLWRAFHLGVLMDVIREVAGPNWMAEVVAVEKRYSKAIVAVVAAGDDDLGTN
jgi:hypothetical protein